MKAKAKRRISITIIPQLDDAMIQISKENGISKSSIMEQAIASFLKAKLVKDAKALSKMKFDDLPTEDEWLTIQND
ncbi:ribbon-helix-helix domain-containing protein [Candidatus Peregrinibacteria bacterium]|jgi:hypothetical protein|nr:ribbon-helix-helix domain-containing protein [Candidatus Peregrinibacteria bacterium]MBT4631787.1 ribbon-helix-helix domain-containing protein [Candidatus Peregrinibacteria bacterium]MBT5516850.1 ribbon-helix-helix domain-containing protein [Candidatus Peregrinibacteria bacterium]MBT5824488.1 ribbon-helix-helix domain-containing protein [Candidatus Peregrinibacteria bacterium]